MSPIEEGERYLPEDVLMEVLARLPVKSIFQFRCVSKYWLHHIPNPNLISLHLNHIINFNSNSFNPTSRILTLEFGSKPKRNQFNVHSLDDFTHSTLLMTTPPSYYPLVINDGLVLMVDDFSHPTYLLLVNPTLNKSLVLPPCPVPLNSCSNLYVMGFSSVSNDFKVFTFRISPSVSDAPFSAVYSLNHGCWTVKDIDFDRNYTLFTGRVAFTKGKAHWWSRYLGHWKVVTFDFDLDKFCYLRLPLEFVDCVDGEKIEIAIDVFSLRGSVAIWYSSNLGFYIWVLDEVGDGGDPMWTRFYHGVPSLVTTNIFFDMETQSKYWFDDKCGKLYIHLEGYNLLSYDYRRDEIKFVGCSYQLVRLVDTYVESLLLCSQPTVSWSGMDHPRA